MTPAAVDLARDEETSIERASTPLYGPSHSLLLLTVYVVLLLAVPSQLTVPALGSIGRPSTVWGLVCLAWWIWHMVTRINTTTRPRQVVRIAYLVFASSILLTYATAHAHGLPSEEVSPSDSAVIRLLSWGGVLLLANDGLTRMSDIELILRRVTLLAGILAVLGLIQFATGEALVDRIQIPGLSFDASLSAIQERQGFTRSSATAAHPLEYAVILVSALPLAITFGLHTRSAGIVRRWWAALAIASASLLAVSRSAIVGLAVSVLVLLPALSRRTRVVVGAVGAVMLLAAYVAVPGLIGTLRGLFLSVGSDSSTESRTGAGSTALDVAANNPLLGRGFGTFLPSYFILDNQYLVTLIELGLIGLISLLTVSTAAIVQAHRARRRLQPHSLNSMIAQALIAAMAATATLYAFFDALSFTMSAGLFFLMAGICGAIFNVSDQVNDPESGQPTGVPNGSSTERVHEPVSSQPHSFRSIRDTSAPPAVHKTRPTQRNPATGDTHTLSTDGHKEVVE